MKLTNIALLGVGRMGEALLSGLAAEGATRLFVYDVNRPRLRSISRKYRAQVTSSPAELVSSVPTVILCVKPQVMKAILPRLGKYFRKGQLVISIAAGITLAYLKQHIKAAALVRVMPNAPALIGEGVSVLAFAPGVSAQRRRQALAIFQALGAVMVLPEKHMDAVTGLSGSGPAFVYGVIDALVKGGQKAGLAPKVAETLAVLTTIGAAKMVMHTGKKPQELINMVASPGGTTLAGLEVLEAAAVFSGISRAVQAAAKRSKALSR